MSKKKQESLFWGIVLLLVGVLFLADNLGFDIDIWDIIADFWPVVLIGIGLKGVLQHFANKKNQEEK